MRFNDTFAGILLVILGGAVVALAQTFPPSPGQNIGPGLFPSVVGGGLGLCGVVLAAAGLRQRGAPWLEFDEWVRRPRMVVNGLVVITDLIFYALAVDRAGFFVTAFVFLAVLLFAFGVRRRWIPVLSAVVTAAMHLIFYSVLHVPLPWGWLEGVAW